MSARGWGNGRGGRVRRDNAHADNGKCYKKKMELEDVCNADGKAQEHRQNTDPISTKNLKVSTRSTLFHHILQIPNQSTDPIANDEILRLV
jgi:hypothetical protein